MSDETAMFVLGGPSLATELGQYVPNGDGVVVRHEPYAALEELSRRRWAAVVVAPHTAYQTEDGEFAGLCHAARRLQRGSRVIALCRPRDEPAARRLTGGVLDDYFITPLSSSQWRYIAAMAEPDSRAADSGAVALSEPEIADLVDAARSTASLEARVADEVGRRLGVTAEWVDAPATGDGEPVLLTTRRGTPRALVLRGSPTVAPDAVQAYLASLRELMPAMTAVAERTESLHRLAVTDHLTGAYNRRYFYHATDRILERPDAESLRVTLLLYDIDDFKRYNDVYGHAAGDEILRETAALMRRITRQQDIVARIGGDEFAVLFWDADAPRNPNSHPPEDACALANRFRRAVEQLEFRALGSEAKGVLSISGGVAHFPANGRTIRDLLTSADRALDEAKQQGKNAIRIVGG
ncbi:MAG: GGDEF domain-containing protein [Phycisphaerae bacterium]|nr:GGDEF domain-containing protein [Phycisphaerae bacterium]